MATTTNYGWEIPDDTDLVKDGAAAIRELGQDIDTTVYGLPSGALTLINTTTFSAVASQSVNNVFTSAYQNYEIRYNITAKSALGAVNFRYRVGGSDDNTANYNQAAIFVRTNNASAGDGSGAATSITSFGTSDANVISLIAQVSNPQLAVHTQTTHQYFGGDSATLFVYLGGSDFRANTVFDGFTLIAASGTITGTVRVYGVQN